MSTILHVSNKPSSCKLVVPRNLRNTVRMILNILHLENYSSLFKPWDFCSFIPNQICWILLKLQNFVYETRPCALVNMKHNQLKGLYAKLFVSLRGWIWILEVLCCKMGGYTSISNKRIRPDIETFPSKMGEYVLV